MKEELPNIISKFQGKRICSLNKNSTSQFKFFLAWLFLFLGITETFAGPRDFMQAQKIAQQKAATLGASISEQNIQQARARSRGGVTPQQTTPYYIFNFNDSTGYAIVGGDDRMPAIVGYSDKSTLNPDNLPVNLKSFLAAYKATVESVEKGDTAAVKNVKAAMKREAGSYTPIAPLLGGIEWSQNAPFNNLCPKYDGKYNAVTGCVATAMAQIMRYWKYPSSLLEGIPAYVSQSYNIPIDSIPNGIGYDWDNMPEKYNGDFTNNQAFAVATLMQHIGASVKMDYGPESGAYDKDVIPALTHYFGYDKDIIKMLDRTNFEWEDWNKILQDELGKKRPIYYCGHSFIGGHAFVCDGMDSDGYYHINWGWGGKSNDYFDITILNPNNGIGFNESNSAILGIVPNNSQDKQPSFEYDRMVVSDISDFSYSSERNSVSDSFSGSVSYVLSNFSKSESVLFTLGIKAEDGHIIPVSTDYLTQLIPMGEFRKFTVNFDYPFPVGEYKLYGIQSSDNGETWKTCYGKYQMLYVTESKLLATKYIYITTNSDSLHYELDLLSKEAKLMYYRGNSSVVSVPSEVTFEGKKYAVRKVACDCFQDNPNLVRVELPEGLTDLGEFYSVDGKVTPMFYGSPLESIDIPKSVVNIGDGCFFGCKNLQAINIPKDSHLEVVGSACFGRCNKLESISFPKSLKEFRGYLEKEPVNGEVKVFGGTFLECKNLRSVFIPEDCKLEYLPMFCLEECYNLVEITLPSSLKVLGEWCFKDCSSLTNIMLPEGTEVLGTCCFGFCEALESINLPSTLREIESYCFSNCHKLQGKLVVPEGVERLGDGSFASTSITSISLPNTIREIGDECFKGCSKLQGNLAIPKGVERLGDCSFAFTSITSISLPNTIREIGDECFKDCTKLVENQNGKLVFPERIERLGNRSFKGCHSLKNIELPNALREIGDQCFMWCDIRSLDFTNCKNLRSIGASAFSTCQYITDILIPEGVEKVGSRCFEYIGQLRKISFPSTLTEIGDSLFHGTFPENFKDIYLYVKEVPHNFQNSFARWSPDEAWPEGYNSLSDCTLHVPKESLEDYKKVATLFKTVVPLTDDETGINQPLLENIRISVTENGIILNGVPQGTPISIYTLGGNMICQKTSGGNTVSFSTSEPMVIAKIGNKSIKIATNKTL